MERTRKILPIAILTALLSFPAQARELSGWVEGRLNSMTLREKLGQLLMVDIRGTRVTPAVREFLEKGRFGGVILFHRNMVDADQTRLMIKQLQDHALLTTGIPLLVSVDQEGGLVNRLGTVTEYAMMRHSARTLGKVYQYAPDRADRLVNMVTGKIARKMRDLGFNMNMAPVLDLTNDRRSYIYDRSYGGDPELVTRITTNYASIMLQHGIIPTGKHFPNLASTRQDSHKELPVLHRTLEDLKRHEFVPFMNLKDKLGAVMVGHVLVPSIDKDYPASVSKRMIGILRNTIGFDGVIVTDDIKMRALSERFTVPEIVLRAVLAGCDMIIMAWDEEKQLLALDTLELAVKKGRIPMRRINEAVARILVLKEKFAR